MTSGKQYMRTYLKSVKLVPESACAYSYYFDRGYRNIYGGEGEGELAVNPPRAEKDAYTGATEAAQPEGEQARRGNGLTPATGAALRTTRHTPSLFFVI